MGHTYHCICKTRCLVCTIALEFGVDGNNERMEPGCPYMDATAALKDVSCSCTAASFVSVILPCSFEMCSVTLLLWMDVQLTENTENEGSTAKIFLLPVVTFGLRCHVWPHGRPVFGSICMQTCVQAPFAVSEPRSLRTAP